MATRDNILNRGIVLMRQHGYYGTSLKMILSACDVPKGSFYHYFGSKEDFTKEAVDAYAASYIAEIRSISDQSLAAEKKIARFFNELITFYQNQNYRLTCLMSILSFEIGSDYPEIANQIDHHFQTMKTHLTDIIREGQEKKNITSDIEAYPLADYLINSFNGALITMKYQQSGQPLTNFRDTALHLIRINHHKIYS